MPRPPDTAPLTGSVGKWRACSRVPRSRSLLGARLRMHVRFAPIYTVSGSEPGVRPRMFGVALLSRHPVISFVNRPLTRWSSLEPALPPSPRPGLPDATIRVHGHEVRVLNRHLDYRADSAVRAHQVSEVMATVNESTLPTVLLGDLNAPPDAPELAPLFTRLDDVWARCTTCGFPYPADSRIDYVLVSPSFRVQRTWVPDTRASDHRPVAADVVLSLGERSDPR